MQIPFSMGRDLVERVKQKTTRYAGGVKALYAKTLLPV